MTALATLRVIQAHKAHVHIYTNKHDSLNNTKCDTFDRKHRAKVINKIIFKIKQFRPRPDPTKCWACSGSKMLEYKGVPLRIF